MRLPVRRVYRAFPELDSYDDERCVAFVKSARGGPVRRALMAAACLVVGLGVAAVWGFVFSRLNELYKLIDLLYSDWMTVRNFVGLTILAVPLGGAILCGFLTRDWLLRKRLVYVLRERGSCPGCGYGLIGLAVSADSRVLCPECGKSIEVDPSLGELTREGRPVIVVATRELRRKGFWTPEKKRLAKRAAIVAALLVFVGGPVVLGVREVVLRMQAGRAATDAETLRRELETPSVAGADGRGVWEKLGAAAGEIRAIDGEVWQNAMQASDRPDAYPEYVFVGRDGMKAMVSAGTAEHFDEQQAIAEKMVAAIEREGVYGRLDELREVRDVRPPDGRWQVDTGMAMSWGLNHLTSVRIVSRPLLGRIATARVGRDRETHVRALETMFAVGRIVSTDGKGEDDSLGFAIEAMAFGDLYELLRSGVLDTSWCQAIDAAMDRQFRPIDLALAMKRDRAYAKLVVAVLYSDPALRRWPSGADPVREMFEYSMLSPELTPFRMGGYERTQADLDAAFSAMAGYWTGSRATQLQAGVPPLRSDLTLVHLFAPQQYSWAWYAGAEARRSGWRVCSAIVRFKAETGRVPEALTELVPKYLKEVPRDPWTWGPIGYEKSEEGWRVFAVGEDLAPGGMDIDAGGTMSVP